jgi:prenyltransferase beta subunit
MRTYWAIYCLRVLGALDRLDKNLTTNFIASLQQEDGHFKVNPIDEPTGPGTDVALTSAAVLALDELGRLDAINVDATKAWLLDAQYSKRMSPRDWWMLSHALEVLGESSQVNATALHEVAKSAIRQEGGLGVFDLRLGLLMPDVLEPSYHRLQDTHWGLRGLYENGLLGQLPQQFLNQTALWVASLQTEDGSFTRENGSMPVQDVFNALGILEMLGRLDLADLDAATDYIESCQVHPYDLSVSTEADANPLKQPYLSGGIADRPVEQHFPTTFQVEPLSVYCVVRSLEILGCLPSQ